MGSTYRLDFEVDDPVGPLHYTEVPSAMILWVLSTTQKYDDPVDPLGTVTDCPFNSKGSSRRDTKVR